LNQPDKAQNPRLILLALLALLLHGCVRESARIDTEMDWQAHRNAVSARSDWNLQGKIGVRAESGSGSAAMNWQQNDEDFRLVLSGALGMGRLVLSGNRTLVSWNDSRGRSGRHNDPDALIEEIWGWDVPVAALQFWIRGIPQPGAAVEGTQLANGLATRFRQAGWSIEPQEYRDIDGLALPTRIRLEGRQATLTVLINRWHVPAP
jgi:outer membrane lipoprotein LolB